ncbi:hypothetical protein V6M85_06630 [Sulfolobus tengchongensis]|uniref:Uncharacterized protein n=1 Tax=Sulfolobus tengchongensis TaxID=207809 RepID=A0AAX4KXP0_9CREN
MERTRNLLTKCGINRQHVINMAKLSTDEKIREIIKNIESVSHSVKVSPEQLLMIGADFRGLYERITKIDEYVKKMIFEKCKDICEHKNCKDGCKEFSESINKYRGKAWEKKTIEFCKKFDLNIDCIEVYHIFRDLYGKFSALFHRSKKVNEVIDNEQEIIDNILFLYTCIYL